MWRWSATVTETPGFRPTSSHLLLYDMAARLRQTDLVVSRAGMTTIAELTALGVPRDPDPAADGDRRSPATNAEAPRRIGAARTIEQSIRHGTRARAEILALAANEPKRARTGAAARLMAKPDAAKVIVDE